ncbi:Hypothetical predicted protein [Mytilus galloprovincialis]|uniref:CCHC-type domain-containing protein n=1 Tax=Mytilus galloprovincialis TaxID=29158 RepID=A0A8B6HUI0_MYTGA|nr:Hypothetical predicted protein [Mytilus galloprovincialis]
MAHKFKEEEIITAQPASPKTPTAEMMKTFEMFEKMGAKPKADTPEDLKNWMMEYLTSQGALKEQKPEPAPNLQPHSLVAPPKPVNVTKMMMNHPPKITWFSGTEPKAGDTTYELWRHEVQCLLKQNYEQDAILNAVRRSLRGEAGLVAMRLELNATVKVIIQKLDSIYGSVDKKEELLAEFYGSRQRPTESVTAWSCRLEGIIGKAVDRGLVQRQDVDNMLHAMIWTGLKPHLKDISGHKYDTIGDFDGLRVALRQIESDHSSRSETLPAETKTHINKAITTQPEDEGLQEIKGLINQIHTRLDCNDKRWEQAPWNHQEQHTQPPQFQPPNQSRQWQQPNQSSPWQQQPQFGQQQQNRGGYRGRGGNQNRGRGQNNYRGGRDNPDRDYQCWRCGQTGHLKIGCKVRMDHSQQHLNSNKPMQGERP